MIDAGRDDFVNYLAEILNISKQAASAKLNGDGKFSEKDIGLLTNKLDFTGEELKNAVTKEWLFLKVSDCAKLLGKSQQFVRIGLQRGILPFGYAVKMSSRWCYHISEKKLYEYIERGWSNRGKYNVIRTPTASVERYRKK